MPKPEAFSKRIPLVEGSSSNVVFSQNTHGRSPSKKHFESLSRSDQRKFLAIFVAIADGERLTIPFKFRDLGTYPIELRNGDKYLTSQLKMWEFKIDGQRILTFRDEIYWVLTNGSPKIAKKAFQGVIATGVNIATEYLNR